MLMARGRGRHAPVPYHVKCTHPSSHIVKKNEEIAVYSFTVVLPVQLWLNFYCPRYFITARDRG